MPKEMVKVPMLNQMAENMLVSTRMILNMVKAHKRGPMVVNIKEIGLKESNTVKENTIM